MNVAEPSERHLSRDGLHDYLASGAPAIVKVDGEPVAYLIIDPGMSRLAMRFPDDHSGVPDLAPYRHFSAGKVAWEDGLWVELMIDGTELLDTYPVLCAVADRVQLGGLNFPVAVREVIASFHELLAAAGRLSDEQELGLFGELLLLEHLIAQMGEQNALNSWRGPIAEEHDFGLESDDVELKTTTSERRRHWINDLEQLTPTVGRSLWLVSVQLTTAGIGASKLPELIATLRSKVLDPETTALLEHRLADAGWRDEQSALYQRRFRARSVPALFRVDAVFPALTTASLVAAGLDPSHFPKVTYMLELSGVLEAIDPPGPIAGFLKALAA